MFIPIGSSVPNPPRKKKVADRPPVAPPNLSSYYEDNELLGCYANQVRQVVSPEIFFDLIGVYSLQLSAQNGRAPLLSY